MKRYFGPREKKAIFFDVNDTLMDSRAALRTGFLKTIGEYTSRWSGGESWDPNRAYGIYLNAWRRMRKGIGRKDADIEAACLREALANAPFSLNERMIAAMKERIRQIKKQTAIPFPGVKGALKDLSGRYALAVITNGGSEQSIGQLRDMGLSDLIPEERVFTPAKGKSRKPDPALFRHALERMGMKPPEGVMVGNSWRNDVCGAARAGMDAVWICRSKKAFSQRKLGREKVVIVHHCRQVADVFR